MLLPSLFWKSGDGGVLNCNCYLTRYCHCYSPKDIVKCSTQLHGFNDASARAFTTVVYLRVFDISGTAHISLVFSKTRAAPQNLTIPRLELCGAHLLSQILTHVQEVLNVPKDEVHAWTDILLSVGSLVTTQIQDLRGTRVSRIMELISPDRWRHVSGMDNPADCVSRGLFPPNCWSTHFGGMVRPGSKWIRRPGLKT